MNSRPEEQVLLPAQDITAISDKPREVRSRVVRESRRGGRALSEGGEHPQGHLGGCEVKTASAGGGRRVSLAEQVVGAKGRRRRDQLSCLCESD